MDGEEKRVSEKSQVLRKELEERELAVLLF